MRTTLPDLFGSLQQELTVRLTGNRELIGHPGTKGDASELDWVGMLEKYLPSRYQVNKAAVLDADGNQSDQIDVVVFDRQYCPLLFNRAGALYVPAESVYAVFEVKQALNKGYVQYAGEKAASVRRLRRTSVPIPHAGGTHEPKQPFRILAGLLTLDSDWNPMLGQPLLGSLCDRDGDERLDLGCCLQHGAFEMLYPIGDAPFWEHSQPSTALVFFFLRLLQRLQQLGTVPAIDLREYGRGL